MIEDNSVVLDFEFCNSSESLGIKFPLILQVGAVRILNESICDYFNGIILPSLELLKDRNRKE